MYNNLLLRVFFAFFKKSVITNDDLSLSLSLRLWAPLLLPVGVTMVFWKWIVFELYSTV